MENLNLKKAIFTPTEIILIKKKGNIVIKVEDIESLEYNRVTLYNLLVENLYMGYLRIILKEKLNGKRQYLVRLKFKDVFKLPPIYRDEIYKQLY